MHQSEYLLLSMQRVNELKGRNKSAEWWDRKKEQLKKFKDNTFYTKESIEFSLLIVCRSNRYEKAIKRNYPELNVPAKGGKWIRGIEGLPDEVLVTLNLISFPFPLQQINSLFATLDSFASRAYGLVNKGKTCEDRWRGAYDTLCCSVIKQISTTLSRYTCKSKLTCTVPRYLFPDVELLKLCQITINRAWNFYEYLRTVKKKGSVSKCFIPRVEDDQKNLEIVNKILIFLIEQMEASHPKGKKRKREEQDEANQRRKSDTDEANQRLKSDTDEANQRLKSDTDEANQRLKSDTDEATGWETQAPCAYEDSAASVNNVKTEVKQEPTDDLSESILDLNESLTETKVEVTVQLKKNPRTGEMETAKQALESFNTDWSAEMADRTVEMETAKQVLEPVRMDWSADTSDQTGEMKTAKQALEPVRTDWCADKSGRLSRPVPSGRVKRECEDTLIASEPRSRLG